MVNTTKKYLGHVRIISLNLFYFYSFLALLGLTLDPGSLSMNQRFKGVPVILSLVKHEQRYDPHG